MYVPDGRFSILYRPLTAVDAPNDVPSIETLTDDRGSLETASTTVPITEAVCENAAGTKNVKAAKRQVKLLAARPKIGWVESGLDKQMPGRSGKVEHAEFALAVGLSSERLERIIQSELNPYFSRLYLDSIYIII